MTVMAGTCSRCAGGDHSSHMASLGGICVGCACTVKVRGEDPPIEKRVDTLHRAAHRAQNDLGPMARALYDLFDEYARLEQQHIQAPTVVVTLARTYLGEVAS